MNLRARIMGLVAVVGLIIAAGIAVAMFANFQAAESARQARYAEQLTRALAAVLERRLAESDPGALDQTLRDVVADTPGLAYAFISRPGEGVLAHSLPGATAATAIDAPEAGFEATAPISVRSQTFLHLKLDRSPPGAEVPWLATRAAIAAVVVLGLGLGVAAVWTRGLVAPLQRLRESEERLRLVVTRAPVVLFALDPEGNFTLSEGKGLEALGLEPGQVVGHNALEMYVDYPGVVADLRKSLAGESVTSRQHVADRYFGVHYEPLLDSRNELYGVIGVAIDQTESEALVQKLERHQQELEATVAERTATLQAQARIIDEIHDAVIALDLEGRVLSWNRGAERMFGYEAQGAVGRHLSFLAPDESGAHLAKEVLNALPAGDIVEVTEQARRRDGSLIDVQLTLSVRREADGTPYGLVAYARDVTDERRIQKALQSSEERYRGLIESQRDLVVRVDPQGRFTFVNEAYCRTFGQQPEALLGKRFQPLIYPKDLPQTLEAMEHLKAPPYRVELEQRALTARGWRWLAWEDYAIRNDEGEIVEIQGVGRDITARKNAQLLLERRSAELSAANEELEAFSYSVSHDLRAPLRALDGYSHALLEDYSQSLDETGRHFLQRIRNAAQRMGLLIEDLLTLSRVGRSGIEVDEIDLSALAREVEEELRSIEPDRDVKIEIDPGVRGWGDRNLLRVVLQNLLGNAWKFTGRTETPRIRFGCERADNGPVYCVSDNGAGFDMKYADKLFGAFQRLHSAKEFEGTGIGLATVQRIVHRHGGRVWAESATGRGARFFFTLPPPLPQEEALTEETEQTQTHRRQKVD